jgi:methyl-accepting chemotaxis protein
MKIMNYFHGLSLRKRLQLSFGTIIVCVLLSAFVVNLFFFNLKSDALKSSEYLNKSIILKEIQLSIANIWQYTTEVALTNENKAAELAELQLNSIHKNLDILLKSDSKIITNNEAKVLENKIKEFVQTGKEMVRAYNKDKVTGNMVMEKFDKKGTEILSMLNPIVDNISFTTKEKEKDFNSTFNLAVIVTLFGVSSVIVIGIITLIKITRYVERNFSKIRELFSKISVGDFSTRITNINDRDEFGEVMWELNEAVDQIEAILKEIITSIKYSSNEKFYRKPQVTGLKGMMKNTAEEVGRAIEKTEQLTLLNKQEKEYLKKNVDIMLDAITKFSEGDLTVVLKSERDDEIGKLFKGFNEAIKNIRNLILQVTDAIEATASAGTQISSSAEEMAAGAQEQSSQTTEVASSIDEMTRTILDTTKNASLAADAAKKAGVIAVEGGNSVRETIEGMNRIASVVEKSAVTIQELGKNSEQIGEIAQVINDIAEQTNLLALNAAIEAARAGEQGRGFAVVADEVRKLAERTAKATKEIDIMIKQIQKDTVEAVKVMTNGTQEVQHGKELADKAEKSLNEIIRGTQEVVDMITQVAAASEEQSSAAENITKNVEIINNVARESAQGIQQIASATEDLSRLTVNLQELINRFYTGSNSKKHYLNEEISVH